MIARSVSHLADSAVLSKVRELVVRGNAITAELLVYLAEMDERKLYLPAGYPSMHAFCTGELGMSEDAASRRITAARKARLFPLVFDAVSDGRLHLTAIVMLSNYLTPVNAEELLRAAMGRSRAKIQELIAEWFPQADVPTQIRAVPPLPLSAPARMDLNETPAQPPARESDGAHGPATSSAPARMSPPFPRVTPIAPQRYAMQFTVDQETHDLLRRAQALLGHEVRSDDVPEVVRRALAALVAKLEKRKFAVTDKPRPAGCLTPRSRHVPADVKRRVRERDGDQCTFVGTNGHRCQEFRRLEFDHVVPVARGGTATFANIRLRCRGHISLRRRRPSERRSWSANA